MSELHTKGFLARLNEEVEKQQNATEPTNTRTLANRISEWWYHLPDTQRKAEYSIKQLTDLFATCPQVLGPTLLDLGWQRRRNWKADEPYRRHWVPPTG